jgi:predicted porin
VPEGLTPNEVRSARIKFTTPVPQVKNASLYGEYENDLVETQNRMVAVGGEYQFRPKTRLYARHEFLDSIQSPYELNRFQERNTTVVGLDTEYMKNGQSFNEYRMRDAMTGREAEAAMGLRNQWPIADGIRANTTLERVNPVIGSEQNEATAVTGAIEYTRNPNWKGTARLELRDATANNSLLNTFGYARKISRDWTFLGRSIVYLVDSETPSGHDTVQARFQAGMAWRQTQTDRWNALLKYEFKIEDGVAFTSSMLDRKVNILSLHANYQPDAPWQISGHYAGKVAFEDLSGSRDVYSAHLLAFRVTYDITKRFDIGINSAVLYSPDPGSAQFALGPEIGFTVAKNLRIGLGYNFTGFRDRDLGAEDYTQQGVYLALRLKFDEESLGLGRKKE